MLSTLIAAGTVLAVAPVANAINVPHAHSSASPSAPTVSSTIERNPSNSSFTMWGSFTQNHNGVKAQLQKSVNGTVWEASSTQIVEDIKVQFATPKTKTGTYYYRIVLPASDKTSQYVGTPVKLVVKKAVLSTQWGTGTTNIKELGKKGFYNTIGVSGKRPLANIELIFERSINNGAWNKVSSHKPAATYTSYSVFASDTVQNVDKGTVKYRFRVVSTNDDYSSVTSTIQTVNYDRSNTVITKNTLNGKKVSVPLINSSYGIQVAFNNSTGLSREVWVQRYNPTAKSWPIQKKVTVMNYVGFNFLRTDPSAQYRIHMPATGTQKSYTGPATQIDRPLNNVALTNTKLRYSFKHVPWMQNTLQINMALSDQKTTVRLQKRNGTTGNSWTTLETRKNVGTGTVKFNLPKGNGGSKNMTAEYRILAAATKYSKQAGTAYMRMTWENPNLYTGTLKTAYGYIKMHCPDVNISFAKFAGKKIGYSSYPTRIIQITSTIPAEKLRTVMLHECAHQRQGSLHGMEWEKFKAKLATIYGSKNPHEMNADCIANAWHKNSYWAYGGDCVGEKGVVAKALASNKKYVY